MQIIEKPRSGWRLTPNLIDYQADCAAFSWDAVARELGGPSDRSGLNIAQVVTARHVAAGNGERVALRCLAWDDGKPRDISYRELSERGAQFADVLRMLGVGRGDTVFSLLGRQAELFFTALGSWGNGCLFCPLFAAFGPEPIEARLALGHARVLVTTAQIYRRKIEALRERLPTLEHVLLVRCDEPDLPPNTLSFERLMQRADSSCEPLSTAADDPALLHFTSGTTGRPKGAVHAHAAVLGHYASGRLALDLHPGDLYWCTADPGWVTGTSYGIIAPLAIGATLIVDEQEFDVARWYQTLQDQAVNVWYTAPTAIRVMMKFGTELAQGFDFSSLRFMASVGEPLNPEAVLWGREAFGLPFHDNWWQTETGGIMIANFQAMAIRPGSMGRPLPGIEAAIVRRGVGGRIERIDAPGQTGELALRRGWPSMFQAYLDDPARYQACFADDWYLSGDLARRDTDGYFWFVGRADDVIKSAGHLIGPFEVESALMEHAAVAEAGVIGKPDALAGEVVKAFVVLNPGIDWNEVLQRQLLAHARKRLGPVLAPKEIQACADLPKTRSGKIMRRLLKARELGHPEGDVSTLLGDNVFLRCDEMQRGER